MINNLGDILIEDITKESIKLYLGEVASKLKASSLCHRIRFIKSLFKWAQEEKYITFNPAQAIKEPKLESKIPKFLTEEEIELLREACIITFEKALFKLCIRLGVE